MAAAAVAPRAAHHDLRRALDDYVGLCETFESLGLRVTFCEGALEIMSSSRLHEMWKTSIARFIELYALERDLPLVGYGSTTFRLEVKERGAEPDECYRVGTLMKDGEFPERSPRR